MKTLSPIGTAFRAALTSLLLGVIAAHWSPAHGQATPRPPERMTYQGYLVGADGAPLGESAPKNYDVIFRIYNDATGGELKWGEQQTVTVDKGYFTILLGEGANTGDPRPALSTIFRGADASERWVSITVKGIGAGGANVDILPRLKLLSSPYTFLAQQAMKLVTDTGSELLDGTGGRLAINGAVTIPGANTIEFGYGVAGKEGSAGRIGYQSFTPGALDIVGAGTTGGNRKVKIWAEGGLTVAGPLLASAISANALSTEDLGLEGRLNPLYPLHFGNFLGDKIALWGDAGAHYGIGIQNSLLQIHTDSAGGDVAFGYGQSGAMTETVRFKGNGNVGIGTALPGAKLHVNGGSIAVTGGDILMDNSRAFYAKNAVGIYHEVFFHPRYSDNVSYINYGSGGFNIRNNVSESALFLGNDRRATFGAGVLAKGGLPGGGNVNNVGYAFSGNGGDNDSGMFSDVDGHVRILSNGNYKFSVYPDGAYVHNGGLVVDSFNGTTFKVTGDVIQVFNAFDKGKYFQMWRQGNSVALAGYGGGWGNASGDFRQITWDGDGNWDASSDRKMKKDIVDAEPVLERALKVQVRRFRWKDDPADAKLALGVIAQELQPLFPDLISTQENPNTKETNLAVGYSDFGLIAIKSIQELKERHDREMAGVKAQVEELAALRAKVADQERELKELTALKAQVAEMKSQMSDLIRASLELRTKNEKSKETAAAGR